MHVYGAIVCNIVVPQVCTHPYNMCMSCEHAYTCIRQKHLPLKKILGTHACAHKHTCTQLRLFPLKIIKKKLHGAYAHKHLKKNKKKKKKKKKKKNSSFPQKKYAAGIHVQAHIRARTLAHNITNTQII